MWSSNWVIISYSALQLAILLSNFPSLRPDMVMKLKLDGYRHIFLTFIGHPQKKEKQYCRTHMQLQKSGRLKMLSIMFHELQKVQR